MTFHNWCVRHGAPYWTLVPARMGETHLTDGTVVPLGQPEIYMAVVPGYIRGGTDAVFTDEALCDLASSPRAERYAIETWQHSDTPKMIEAGVLLLGSGANNYFHWLMGLSRLFGVEHVPPEIPLLVDQTAAQIPQLIDALRTVTQRRVIEVGRGEEYFVEQLVVPSYLAWMPVSMSGQWQPEVGDSIISPEAVAFLRNHLGQHGPATKRIYIIRTARTAPVRLQNEPSVRDVFESLGFEAVRPETMTFAEQRELFGRAAVIAGESGAGMTNILLAPKKARLICFQAYACPVNGYADLAGHAGQKATFIANRPDTVGEYQEGFTVDPEALHERLVALL